MMEEMHRPHIPYHWLPFRGEEEYKLPRVFRPLPSKPASLAGSLVGLAFPLGWMGFMLGVTYFNHLYSIFWVLVAMYSVLILFYLLAILDGSRRKARKIAFWSRRSPPPEA